MELTADEAWSRILDKARARVPEQGFRTWLAPTSAVALSKQALVVGAPSDFAVEWIEQKYGEMLDRLARDLFGEEFSLSFESRANGADAATPLSARSLSDVNAAAAPDAGDAEVGGGAERGAAECAIGDLNPRYTLDRFVIGRNSQLAAAACQAVAASPGRAYNPLFIYGGVGLGKTHLMHGVGHAVLQRHPERRVAYVPTEQFMNELIAAIQGGRTTRFHRRYRDIDVLLVDDAHFLADKERTQEEFFHTFNALYDTQRQIVLTSDRPPKEIPGLQERLVSRFEWGLVTDVKPPDFETRVAILQKKAEEDGLSIGHDVLRFIATHCQSSVRELEGAIIKLLAFSSLTHREITVELAKEALGRPARPATVSAEDLRARVAEAYHVTEDALVSRSRSRDVTVPRQVAMYLIKRTLDLPYTQIGRLFGDRDHSTVIHSIRKVEETLESDDDFRARVEGLRAEFA